MNALIYNDPYSRIASAWAHVRDGVVYSNPYQEISPPNTSDYAIGHVERDGMIYATPYTRHSASCGATIVGRVDANGIIYSDARTSIGTAVAHVSGGYIYSEPYSEVGCAVGQYEGDAMAAAAAWYLMTQEKGELSSSGGYASVPRKKVDEGFTGPDGVYYRNKAEYDMIRQQHETAKQREEERQRHKQWLASLSKEERARYYEEKARKEKEEEAREYRENVQNFFVGMGFSAVLVFLSILIKNGNYLLFGALMGLVGKVCMLAGIAFALLSMVFLIQVIQYILHKK